MAGTVKKCAAIKSLDVITKMISKAAFDAEVSPELVSKRAACDWPRITQNIVVDAKPPSSPLEPAAAKAGFCFQCNCIFFSLYRKSFRCRSYCSKIFLV